MIIDISSAAIGIIGLIYLIFALWLRSSLTQQKTRRADLQERIKQMHKAISEIQCTED